MIAKLPCVRQRHRNLKLRACLPRTEGFAHSAMANAFGRFGAGVCPEYGTFRDRQPGYVGDLPRGHSARQNGTKISAWRTLTATGIVDSPEPETSTTDSDRDEAAA